MKAKLLSEGLSLDPEERIRLAQDLWDSVSEVPSSDPLTELQKQELDRRLQAIQERPDQSIPWKKVFQEIRDLK